MILIKIDLAISNTDTIFFDFDIAYVFHLAHAWAAVFVHEKVLNITQF